MKVHIFKYPHHHYGIRKDNFWYFVLFLAVLLALAGIVGSAEFNTGLI